MSSEKPPYHALVEHYENCLRAHGQTPRGVDWPNLEDLWARFRVMLGCVREGAGEPVDLLDLGCGFGMLLDYLDAVPPAQAIRYQGIDLSEPMIAAARARHPGHAFEQRDLLKHPLAPQSVDYAVLNGVLTERRELPQATMVEFAQSLLAATFRACRRGLAFNVMNEHVDWKRDDLFHWPFDEMFAFIKRELSRHAVIRADYGLYEYTVYVYREPCR